jgi:gliding motility-associated-like protein
LPIIDSNLGQTYSVSSCGNPVNGNATLIVNGNQVCISYTPNTNYNGLDSLCVIVCNNASTVACDTSYIHINVTPVNDSPVVNDTTITTNENNPVTVCLQISDGESGQTYSVSSCGNPINGNSTSVVTGNQVCITYTPNPNYSGLDSLCIIICDNGTPSLCDTSYIYINVSPVNNPPVVNDTTITTTEDNAVTVCLPITDSEIGQTYSVSSCGNTINGTAVTSINGNQLCITYTPNANFYGLDSMCVIVCDNGTPSACDTTYINFNVSPVNDKPLVNDTSVVTDVNSAVSVCLPIIDVENGQTYSVSSCGNPLNGNAVTSINGSQVCITYTPNNGYVGLDSMCIIVCDGGSPSMCDTAYILINVQNCSAANPLADCDGDGVNNGTEATDGTNANDPCSYNPTNQITANVSAEWSALDCDGDGVTNSNELINGTDPNNPCDIVLANQTVATSITWNNLDCDGDGITNGVEVINGSNPFDKCSPTPCGLNVPEGFSPNGDGTNDLYVIRGIEDYSNNSFIVFNRWGNKVFDAKPYTNTWDGKTTMGLRVGGDELPVGTYFYILDLGDGSPVIKGYIYLNR